MENQNETISEARLRAKYIDLMIKILVNSIYEDPGIPGSYNGHEAYDERRRAVGGDWPRTAHTMVGVARLNNLKDLVERTIREEVPGDYIETGVWRGGCCILMRAILSTYDDRQRKVYVADSFEGLPAPKPETYPADADDPPFLRHPALTVSEAQVRKNFTKYGLLDNQVVFIRGFFSDTLPELAAQTFALLRLDGDMYESTIVALESLYPKLSSGGYIIIDDYGAVEGCRKAVDDYRARHSIDAPLNVIDWGGVWWRKGHRERKTIDWPASIATHHLESHAQSSPRM